MQRRIRTPSKKLRQIPDPNEGVVRAYFRSLLKAYIYTLGVLVGLGILALGGLFVYYLFEVFGKSP